MMVFWKHCFLSWWSDSTVHVRLRARAQVYFCWRHWALLTVPANPLRPHFPHASPAAMCLWLWGKIDDHHSCDQAFSSSPISNINLKQQRQSRVRMNFISMRKWRKILEEIGQDEGGRFEGCHSIDATAIYISGPPWFCHLWACISVCVYMFKIHASDTQKVPGSVSQ